MAVVSRLLRTSDQAHLGLLSRCLSGSGCCCHPARVMASILIRNLLALTRDCLPATCGVNMMMQSKVKDAFANEIPCRRITIIERTIDVVCKRFACLLQGTSSRQAFGTAGAYMWVRDRTCRELLEHFWVPITSNSSDSAIQELFT